MKKLILLISLISFNTLARDPIPASRFQPLSGVKISGDSKTQWDQRYSRPTFIYGKTPVKFLAENYHYIPFESTVLDMGMGEGKT
jgi:hypothetical protein